MQALSPGEHRVHEGAGQVETSPRVVQHPLHEGAHVLVRENEAGQLRDPAAGHEHAGGRIDPDFLHARIVHEGLKGAEAADVVHQVRFDLLALSREHVGGMGVNGAVNEDTHGPGIPRGIDAARCQTLSYPRGECTRDGFHR